MLAPSACCLHLFPLLPSHGIILYRDRSAFPLKDASPARVISVNASIGTSCLVVGTHRMATGSVKEVEGFDRFKGGLFKTDGAANAGDGEKLEDGGS